MCFFLKVIFTVTETCCMSRRNRSSTFIVVILSSDCTNVDGKKWGGRGKSCKLIHFKILDKNLTFYLGFVTQLGDYSHGLKDGILHFGSCDS